jgi:hypothetical protein
MTKSKRMFAELLVQAQGHGDAEEIAKTMSLVDIIYEMKKVEEEAKKKAEPEPEPEKKAEPSSTEAEEPEPIVVTKIKDFWSRLTHDSDSD